MDLEQFRKIYSDYRLAEARAKSAQYSSWDYSAHRFTMRSAPPKEELYTRKETLVPRPPDGSKLNVTTYGNPLTGGITSNLAGKDYRDTSSKFVTYANLFGHEDLDSSEIDIIKQTMNSLNATIFTENVKSLADSTKTPGLILSESVVQFMQASITTLYNIRDAISQNDQATFVKSGLDLQRLATNQVLSQRSLPENTTKLLQGLILTVKTQLEIFSKSEEVESVQDAILDVQNLNTDAAQDVFNQNIAINENSTKPQQVLDPLARRIEQIDDANIKKINTRDVESVNVFLSDFARAITNGTLSSSTPTPPVLQTSLIGDKTSFQNKPLPENLSPNIAPNPAVPAVLPTKDANLNADVASSETVRDAKDALIEGQECSADATIPSNVTPPTATTSTNANFVGKSADETKTDKAGMVVPEKFKDVFIKFANMDWPAQRQLLVKFINTPNVMEYLSTVDLEALDIQPTSKNFLYIPKKERAIFLSAFSKDPNFFSDGIVFNKEGVSKGNSYVKENGPVLAAMEKIRSGSGIPKGRGRPRKRERSELKDHQYVGSGIIPAVLGDLTLSTDEVLTKHGCDIIYDMTLLRSPLPTHMNDALDMVSSGEFTRLKKKYNFDEVFHSAIKVNSTILIEKNAHGINVAMYKPYPAQEEVVVSRLFGKPDMTIKNLLGRTKDVMGDKFYTYNAFGNNCQLFISTLLKANGLMKPEYANFIYQDMTELLKDLTTSAPLALPLINATTAALGIKQKIDAYNEYNKKQDN